MDTDGSGAVDVGEIRSLLTTERKGQSPSEAEVQEMLASFDKNADGKVTFAEYLTVLM